LLVKANKQSEFYLNVIPISLEKFPLTKKKNTVN